MAKGRILGSLVAGLLLLGGVSRALADPTVPQMLNFCKPKQEGVVFTTPTKEEEAFCEVKANTGAGGWILLDAKKRPLRRYIDSDGDGKIDTWSYFKDGVEVYRDLDTNKNNVPDQSRWLNTAGSKWGVDINEDGKIDAWRMISTEEAAQELFLAVQNRDLARFKALLVTEAEIAALKLPQAEVDSIRDNLAKAEKKFNETVAKATQLTKAANFVRVESGPPTCLPAVATGPVQDVIRYSGRAILFEGADKKHDWIQTGQMILIGQAWKLTDAPAPGDMIPPPDTQTMTPEMAALVKALAEMDQKPVPMVQPGTANPVIVEHMLKRVQLLEQIIAKVPAGEDRDNFTKQSSDNLSTAYQAGDTASLPRLEALRDLVAKAQPGSITAGYVAFRRIWAEFAGPLSKPDNKDFAKVQERWLEALSKFVQSYPKAEDTPDALMHLAMGSEFAGKEEEAKRWYQQMVTTFPTHSLAEKARGAIRRLDVVGQPMQLAGTTSTGAAFDISKLSGKVVVAYYWASYCDNVCVGEFAQLKQLQGKYAAQGLEIVAVNLDDKKDDGEKFLARNPLSATHLFPTGPQTGLNSTLALHYGTTGLPMMFLVGKDGRVISRTLQISNLEDAIKKAIK